MLGLVKMHVFKNLCHCYLNSLGHLSDAILEIKTELKTEPKKNDAFRAPRATGPYRPGGPRAWGVHCDVLLPGPVQKQALKDLISFLRALCLIRLCLSEVAGKGDEGG